MYILEINHAKNILFFMYSLCLIYFILLCFQIFRYTRQTRKDVLVQKMEETSATKQETSQLGPCEVIFSDMSEVRSFKQYLSRQGLAKCRLLHGIKKKETDTETEKNTYYDSGAPVTFKTWCGHQYRDGIICPLWLRQG